MRPSIEHLAAKYAIAEGRWEDVPPSVPVVPVVPMFKHKVKAVSGEPWKGMTFEGPTSLGGTPVIRVGDRAAYENVQQAARIAGVSTQFMYHAMIRGMLINKQRWVRFTPLIASCLLPGGGGWERWRKAQYACGPFAYVPQRRAA